MRRKMQMLSFDEYLAAITQSIYLDIDEQASPEADFEAVGIDSLQAFELILLTEEMTGQIAPPVEMPQLFTLGDAYRYYVTCLGTEDS
jgi:acyl carrier protein